MASQATPLSGNDEGQPIHRVKDGQRTALAPVRCEDSAFGGVGVGMESEKGFSLSISSR
jgi:hypothetical protein